MFSVCSVMVSSLALMLEFDRTSTHIVPTLTLVTVK